MKSIFKLVFIKQWKQYIALLLILIASLSIILFIESTSNKIFKMPIAIQDMDHSKESKTLINTLDHTKFIDVIHLSKDEAYIEDVIKKKEAIVSLQIPDDFSNKLKKNDLRDAIPLYYRDDFVGEIALEVTSKALYKQQIPVIISNHLKKSKQDISYKKIVSEYKKDTPSSKMEQNAVKKNSDVSISAGLIVALLIIVSCSQIVLHQRLKQNAALERLMMFNGTKLKLYMNYIIVHTLLLCLTIFVIGMILSWSLSAVFYITTLFTLFIYEIGMSILLFKVNTMSHKLFMSIIWSIAISIVYIFLQI
nr:ABC transporter permease [Mammaliicoccus sp. Marseille-Q6498]